MKTWYCSNCAMRLMDPGHFCSSCGISNSPIASNANVAALQSQLYQEFRESPHITDTSKYGRSVRSQVYHTLIGYVRSGAFDNWRETFAVTVNANGFDADEIQKDANVPSPVAGIRDQILDMIVRQALVGMPWREHLELIMQANKISPEEVEAEIQKRKELSGSTTSGG
jgi:hypothetical protein